MVVRSSKRIVIFGPDSVHTHRWADYLRNVGWHVTWIAYGSTNNPNVPAIDEVTLERGGRLAVGRTVIDLVRSVRQFRRILKKLNPDIVQTHWLLGPAWIASLAGKHPIVATAWGSDVLMPFPGRRMADLLTRALGKRIDAITSSSQPLEDALVNLGLPRGRLHRVVHGIDAAQFKPLPRNVELLESLGVDPSLPVILSSRGVLPVYDPETVLAAFSKAVTQRPSTLLLRVPTDQRTEWHRLRNTLAQEVRERVITFTGLEREEFPSLLASSDVVLSVARSDGSSITVMEALFCERPIIVSDIPQNREWIPDPRFGTIIRVGDAEALAHGINVVLSDPAAAAAKARIAAKSARKIGSQDVGLGAVVRLYDRLLERAGTT
jgi:L-malate glycosyltransferase